MALGERKLGIPASSLSDSPRIRRASEEARHFPSPATFGDTFPAKFTEWRPDQADTVLRVLESERRFVGVSAPTGFGKSLAYIGAALLGGKRVAILTSTKGLQEQIERDFNGDGNRRVLPIMGQNAYKCVEATTFGYPEYTTVDFAPCHAGANCAKRLLGCRYYDQLRLAQKAQVVSTNYAFWMSSYRYSEGLGKFDLLVLDEAHDAPDLLADFMGVEIDPAELRVIGGKMLDRGADVMQWAEWAANYDDLCQTKLDNLASQIRQSGSNVPRGLVEDSAKIKKLKRKLEVLSELDSNWITEWVQAPGKVSGKMHFDPLWPYQHSEDYLFMGIPRVALFSATVRPKTLRMLGIDEADYEFLEYQSSFPVNRRPFIHVPTIQLNHRTDEGGLRTWLNRIDQICRARPDRKGVIHSVSFKRAQMIKQNSEFGSRMLLNESSNTRWTVQRFKESGEPIILVSPSLSTGWDFPHDECRFQIIGKLPFPDNRAKITKARMEADKEYSDYMTMQNLVQMYGRGNRAVDDWCETFCIDDNVVWFLRHNAKFAPQWFKEALVWANSIPPPLDL